jgi:hypothetical protein
MAGLDVKTRATVQHFTEWTRVLPGFFDPLLVLPAQWF